MAKSNDFKLELERLKLAQLQQKTLNSQIVVADRERRANKAETQKKHIFSEKHGLKK